MSSDDADKAALPPDMIRELYGADPSSFLVRRAESVKRLRSEGDADLARQVGALRKPTVSAAYVNRLVHDDESVAGKIAGLGDRLRAAHNDLDVAVIRDLSETRRRLVAELVAAATEVTGQDPSAAVRDEIAATLEAAIADPEVQAHLGRLVRPERWSGFIGGQSSTPSLTLVANPSTPTRSSTRSSVRTRPEEPARSRGPASGNRTGSDPTTETPVPAPAARRRTARVLAKAEATHHDTVIALEAAEAAEQDAKDDVGELSAALADVTRRLEQARRDLEAARKAARAARTRRREARSALDRAQRNAD